MVSSERQSIGLVEDQPASKIGPSIRPAQTGTSRISERRTDPVEPKRAV